MNNRKLSETFIKPRPQVLSPVGIPSAEGFGMATVWQTYKFAPDWFNDAHHEARNGSDHHSRRREILFAVCAVESYLLEWVRDEVLDRDFQKLNQYFPPSVHRGVANKWKEVPKQLFYDGYLPSLPKLAQPSWQHFLQLVEYRNGLIHARSSRPENSSLADNEKPVPSKSELDNLPPGWAVGVVFELINGLHQAVGTASPAWLVMP
jgi:hypothetical protein